MPARRSDAWGPPAAISSDSGVPRIHPTSAQSWPAKNRLKRGSGALHRILEGIVQRGNRGHHFICENCAELAYGLLERGKVLINGAANDIGHADDIINDSGSDGIEQLRSGTLALQARHSDPVVIPVTKVVHKGSEEARNELPALIEEAQRGRPTIITRRGRPVAALVPLAQFQPNNRQQSLLTLEGAGRGVWGKNSGSTIKKLRGEWSR